MKLKFPRQIIDKISNIKFHNYPSSGSRVVPCRRPGGRTDMTKLIVKNQPPLEKLIVAFRNFLNAPWKVKFGPVTCHEDTDRR